MSDRDRLPGPSDSRAQHRLLRSAGLLPGRSRADQLQGVPSWELLPIWSDLAGAPRGLRYRQPVRSAWLGSVRGVPRWSLVSRPYERRHRGVRAGDIQTPRWYFLRPLPRGP